MADLTRCPQLNDLIEGIEQHQAGTMSADKLKDALRAMESLYTAMRRVWDQNLRLQEKTSPAAQAAPHIEATFKALRKGLEEVRAYWTDKRPEQLSRGIDAARAAMTQLLDSFDRLAEAEQNLPQLSTSPYMHHVLRVGRAVVDGTLPPEVFREILTRMFEMHRATVVQVKDARMRELMDQVQTGLTEAERFFSDQDKGHITRGLEAARVATQTLHELQQSQSQPATKCCLRCGRDNPSSARTCSCGFRFPAFIEDVETAIDVSLDDGGVRQGSASHAVSENTKRLVDAVEKVQRGGSSGDMLRAVDDLLERVGRGQQDLSRMAPPPNAPPDELEFVQGQRATLEEGLALMEQGLQRLRQYAVDHSPDHLNGLETVLSGADRLAAVQAVAQSIPQAGA
ncbi:MAG: hypothetical protein ACYCW6_07280 [Candidatus Xenobia bacterium]